MSEVAKREMLTEAQLFAAGGVSAPMTGQMLNMISEAAANPATDVEKLKALLGMQKELLADEAKAAYHLAMASAQAEMVPIVKDRSNDHTKSKYATLEAVDESIRPIYTKHGFSLSSTQLPSTGREDVAVRLLVTHRGGHTEPFDLSAGVDTAGPSGTKNKTHIQGVGSSVTYLRRYLTLMAFNLIIRGEDNDGNKTRQATRISEEQKNRIVAELKYTGTDTLKFLSWAQAKTVDEILADQYPDCMMMFGKRRQEKKLLPISEPPPEDGP